MKKLTAYYDGVKEDYPNFGAQYCATKYNIELFQVSYIARKFNLHVNKKLISENVSARMRGKGMSRKVDFDNFTNLAIPFNCYLLGLLWADGHVNKKHNTIVLSSTYPDVNYVSPLLSNLGWSIYRSKDKNFPSWKERCFIQTNNNLIKDFLNSHGFSNKLCGFDSIFSIIPFNNIFFFLRGLSDGDGCFFYHHRKSLATFSITSGYTQQWGCLESLLTNLEIEFSIERTRGKSGSYSKLNIRSLPRVVKWGELLYQGFDEDGIGLLRKYNKYLEIKNHKKRHYIRHNDENNFTAN